MKKIFNVENALPENKKNVTYMLGIFGFLYVLILYLLGMHFGFYKATVTLSIKTCINIILPIIFIIIGTEMIREKILAGNWKHKRLIAFCITVFIEIAINIGKYDITNINGFLTLTGYVGFVAIVQNLLFNYIAIRYGKVPNIVYRIVITLYIYCIPITPNIHVLIHTTIKMIMPYIIYITLEYAYSEKSDFMSKQNKRRLAIINVVLIAIMVMITMLVSCKFHYGILVIGSESMTGVIDKGDAVIFEEFKNQKIKNGQIIIFKTDKMIVVHRVVEIKNANEEIRYYTKGDANEKGDQGYITNEQIMGIYKTKISKVGYLTLWFNDIFKK